MKISLAGTFCFGVVAAAAIGALAGTEYGLSAVLIVMLGIAGYVGCRDAIAILSIQPYADYSGRTQQTRSRIERQVRALGHAP